MLPLSCFAHAPLLLEQCVLGDDGRSEVIFEDAVSGGESFKGLANASYRSGSDSSLILGFSVVAVSLVTSSDFVGNATFAYRTSATAWPKKCLLHTSNESSRQDRKPL